MVASNPVKSCPGCADAAVRQTLSHEQQCNHCRKKERHRLWRKNNPGVAAIRAKVWREVGNKTERSEEYKEQQRTRMRERYHTDPEVNARTKAAAQAQRERLTREELSAQHKAWRLKNPGKTREYYLNHIAKLDPAEQKSKGKTHRERYRVQRQAGMAAYNARRRDADGTVPNEHLYALHKWQDHRCFYCRRGLEGKDTIEHVVPLIRGGSNNPWNVVLACGSCNSQKGARIYGIEWSPSQIEPTPHHHSVHSLGLLKKRLAVEGIEFIDAADHIVIQERPAYIMSSFWLGWQGDAVLRGIKERQPSAIIFFDKEFERRPDAIVNVLKAKAGIAQRVGARKLRLEVPTTAQARDFIGKWHAMGPATGTEYLGLRDDDDWWAVAAFRREVDHYEVIRMAIRETVAGGVSRILHHFQEHAEVKLPIVTFTDQRMGDGKSHFFAGFDDGGTTERSFFYATPEVNGFHPRRDFQKQVLEQRADYFDPHQTQVVLAKANALMRVEGLPRLRFTMAGT